MDILNPSINNSKSQGPQKDLSKVEFKEDILDETIKDFEQRKTDRQFLELQMRLNMDFYDGNQFSYINKHTKNVEESEKMYWYQEMEVFNQIAPNVETRLAKLGRLRPIPKTRPATNTDDDIANAKISNKLLETSYYDQKIKDKQDIANMWSELTGTVIWKPIWNDNIGELITMSEDGEAMHEGNVEAIVVNPFEIYPDSLWHDDVEDCNSIIHAKAYTAIEVKDIWGVEVTGEEVNVLTVNSSAVNTGGIGQQSSGYRITNRQQKNSVIVIEKWEMPSKKHSNGRLIICTDKEILYIGDLPYKVGTDNNLGLPFINQKAIKTPGRFFGKSIIERLIPLQRRYNALKNRKAEYINRVSIGQMVYEEGSVDADFLEEEGTSPGLMIPYRAGFNPPKYLEFHNLPAEFAIEEQNILSDFIRISGISELSKDSSAPTGVKSGIALGILQEQDDTRLSLTAGYIVSANISLGEKILRLYKQFADTDRLLRSVGENQTVELVTWNSSNVTSDDVYVDSQAQSLESTAQRRNMVFDLLGTGLFNDPETGGLTKESIAKIFDLIDLGNWEMGNDTDKLHLSKVDRENQILISGQWKDIDNYDDHLIHIKRHNRFRLTTNYEKIVAGNPQINVAFEYHVMQHVQFIQDSMMPEPGQVVESEDIAPDDKKGDAKVEV